MKNAEMTLAQRLVNPNPNRINYKVRISPRMFMTSNFTGVWSLYFETGFQLQTKHLATFDFNKKTINKDSRTEITKQKSKKLIELEELTKYFELMP